MTTAPSIPPSVFDGAAWGLAVTYSQDEIKSLQGETAPFYFDAPYNAGNFDGPDWTPLPLTTKLYRTICFRRGHDPAFPLPTNITPNNEVLNVLSLDCDPNSETFGKCLLTADCDIIFVRSDRWGQWKPEEEQMRALVAYTKIELADVLAFGKIEAEEGTEEYKQARAKAIFAAQKADRVDYGWFSLQCVTGGTCNKCGYPGGWKDKTLSVDCTCESVKYCSEECQMGDWKDHEKSKAHTGAA